VAIAEGEHVVTVASLEAMNAAIVGLIARGTTIVSVSPAHSTLEEHFRQVVREGKDE
jgi:hypothetical protein